MAIDYKTPAQIGDEYLLELSGLKPTVNTKQQDLDWWIRSRVVGGAVSGLYADQRLIANDAFPQRSRRDALSRHLDLWLQRDFNVATTGQGPIALTGTVGSSVAVGDELRYLPNGNVYQVTENHTLTGVNDRVQVVSVATGQSQNLLDGAVLTFSNAPIGIDSVATVIGGISDARDPETSSEASEAILTRIRDSLSVGRDSDYAQYAIAADPAVVSASVIRYPFGLGTVGVYITSGTTDIDSAIDADQAVSQIPSEALVAVVQAYLNINRPVTDCVTVFQPTALPIDVTLRVRYKNGLGSTINSGETVSQEQLVKREIYRAIYKTPTGGRQFDGLGYVVLSDMEETVDAGLSAEPTTSGKRSILLDRNLDDLSATGFNRMILPNERPIPGTITVIEL